MNHHFNPRSHTGSDRMRAAGPADGPISIHAPTRGATARPLRAFAPETISIHAPTRGATIFIALVQYHYRDFNPRSHTGSDLKMGFEFGWLPISIHAPTRGATPWYQIKTTRWLHFNPRSHTGSDDSTVMLHLVMEISIHAPTRGATSYCLF